MLLSNTAAALEEVWFPIALVSAVGDVPQVTSFLGTQYVVARVASGVVMWPNACPHRGAPLHLGQVSSSGIVCRYHGALVCADPSGPFQLSPAGPVPRLAEADGLVWAALAPTEERPSPDLEQGRFERTFCAPATTWHAPASVILENFLDYAHFGSLHGASFCAPGERPTIVCDAIQSGRRLTYQVMHRGRRIIQGGGKSRTEEFRSRTVKFNYTPPYRLHLELAYEGIRTRDDIFLYLTPADKFSTHVFKIVCSRDADPEMNEDAGEAARLQRMVSEEDREICESIGGEGIDTSVSRSELPGDISVNAALELLNEFYGAAA